MYLRVSQIHYQDAWKGKRVWECLRFVTIIDDGESEQYTR